MKYVIYLTVNMVNHKVYIGVHKTNPEIFDGYLGSGTALKQAIKKYGKHNFIVEVLCQCQTEEELNKREIEYIEKFNAVCIEDFYNVSFDSFPELAFYVWLKDHDIKFEY